MDAPVVVLRDGSGWRRYRRPIAIHVARRVDEVRGVLAAIEDAVAAGYHAAGFLAYEATPAFDDALAAHLLPSSDEGLPLAWWGVFAAAEPAPPGFPDETRLPAVDWPLPWRPAIDGREHAAAIAEIRRRIARGETYQVNFTFPLVAPYAGDPLSIFAALHRAQPAPFAAYLDLGSHALCSASPELFFELDGESVVARPMKGTRRRGRYATEDQQVAAELAAAAKDRAENVMIVDMLRNDLGRVALPGSVEVDALFRVETYPTVHQLTSRIRARTTASWSQILAALFPCASITGAPKVAASHLIRRLEAAPRGAYTGTIGFVEPGRKARMSVAIRTATVDRAAGQARFGTGGGIVWDSEPAAEWDECRAKALVLTALPPPFELLETLLWRPVGSFFLLARHLDRLAASARYFGFAIDLAEIRRRLDAAVAELPFRRHRVRLLLARDGGLRIETQVQHRSRRRWRLAVDDRPVDSSNRFLCNKTTHRAVYDAARARHPGADDVVLWNERGELTETTSANLVLDLDGELLTPVRTSGLLAGTLRAALLDRGRIRESMLPRAALMKARRIYAVNGVRGIVRGDLSVSPSG